MSDRRAPTGRNEHCVTPDRVNGHPADFNRCTGFPTEIADFGPSKINDLDTPQNRGSGTISCRGIVGPRCAIDAEIINARAWQEVVSTAGVVSYVSRIGKRALRDGGVT
jgi:hypothetical protein